MKVQCLTAVWSVLLSLGAWTSTAVLAQTGAIYTSFGTVGIAQNVTVTGDVTQVMGLSDGKVLAAGRCTTGFGSGACLYRWTSAGVPDSSFGISGVSFVLPNALDPRFVLRPDGRIAVLAWCRLSISDSRLCLAQTNANGTGYDPGFASGAPLTLAVPNVHGYTLARMGDLALLPDGRLLLGGTCYVADLSSSGFCVQRITTTGAIDTSFGVAPHHSSTTAPGPGDELQRLTLLPDGRYLGIGKCGGTQPTSNICIGRFFANGGFQNTYTIDVANRWEVVTDARVVGPLLTLSGRLQDFVGPTWNSSFPFAARREIYAVPGNMDTNFGGIYPTTGIAGGLNIDSSNDGDATGASVIAHDGGIVFAGRCNSGTVLCLMRLAANGTLDSAFGVNGRYEYAGYLYPNAGAATGTMGKGVGQDIYLGGGCPGERPCVYRFTDIVQAAPRCSLDIDGDGRVHAATDGLILVRALLGFSGSAALANALGPGATRTTWPQVREHLYDQCQLPVPVN